MGGFWKPSGAKWKVEKSQSHFLCVMWIRESRCHLRWKTTKCKSSFTIHSPLRVSSVRNQLKFIVYNNTSDCDAAVADMLELEFQVGKVEEVDGRWGLGFEGGEDEVMIEIIFWNSWALVTRRMNSKSASLIFYCYQWISVDASLSRVEIYTRRKLWANSQQKRMQTLGNSVLEPQTMIQKYGQKAIHCHSVANFFAFGFGFCNRLIAIIR